MSETENAGATLLPVVFAIGVAVLFVGLVVNLQVVAPLGGAIALVAGLAWVRSSGRRRRPVTARPSASAQETGAERFPRNRLLERATLGLGGLVALGAVLPAVGAAVLPAFLNQRRKAIDLGPLGDFPQGQFVLATFLSDRAMGEISRRVAYVRNNGLLGKSPSFTIMSNRCTHVGCPTQPNGPVFGEKRRALKTANGEVGLVPTDPAAGFGCPCHGSQFDTEGNRTAGPAPRALDRYRFSIRRGHLWLGDIYSVSRVQGAGANARIDSFKRLGDGEPATGPERLLYPVDPIS
jgi:Rieske Fe-S protein